ncbi:aldo/keto reductase [Nocardioides immobilis]|uniref:Aldo/keto reductase n=1 Tax=Nocardioides immobilis TaxID=2049295 RepID=A0A417XYL3_9ACTN|nr:aldo/keto reductase [Nocardioides immobilis]RHW25445.1 aldo/keto reductase [Nocardioides immobilis]
MANGLESLAEPRVEFCDGASAPQLGLGLYRVLPGDTERVVDDALELGYRRFDTAPYYGNERQLGLALRAASKTDVFITTKVPNESHGFREAIVAVEKSLTRLDRTSLNMVLIHWPQPRLDRYLETWSALEYLQSIGLVRSIGVSNFTCAMLSRLCAAAAVVPAVNQVELHPYLLQSELRAWHATLGVATEAWSPIGRGRELLHDPKVVAIARRHGCTPAQAVLAWHLGLGTMVIPKSAHRERMRENFAATEIRLTPAACEEMCSLGTETRYGPDPDDHG